MIERDQPLDRVIAVLGAVASAKSPKSVTEIAADLGLPGPTVHRQLAQLLERELLKREIHTKRVLVGPRLVELGASILEAAILADHPHRILVSLANRLGEHCHIGIIVDDEVLYADTARVDRAIGLQFQPGRRAPLHCTSTGKLYLASLPPRELASWISNSALPSFTPQTVVDGLKLSAEIEIVRQRGSAESHGEFVEGVSGCAVPIRRNGRFIAGLGVSGPSLRLNPARIQEILPHLMEASRAIADAL